jgi:hypothetical protein
VRVLSDGARSAPRTLLTRAPGVDQPTAGPAARAPWFERAWLLRPFTPRRLWSSDPAMVIAFPDLEARGRMTRRERLAWGGGSTSAPRGTVAPLAPVVPLRRDSAASSPLVPNGMVSPIAAPAAVAADCADPAAVPRPDSDRTPARAEELRAELAAELGAAGAAAVPLDLLEVVCHAWGGFRGRARGS